MNSRNAERVEVNLREHLDLRMEGRIGFRESEKKSLKDNRKIRSMQSGAGEAGRKVYNESSSLWRSEERE